MKTGWIVYGSKAASALIGFCLSVIIARAIGTEGRADYFLVAALAAGVFAVFGLSLDQAIAWTIAERKVSVRRLLVLVVPVLVVLSLAGAAAYAVLAFPAGLLDSVPRAAALVGIVLVPLLLGRLLVDSILYARHRARIASISLLVTAGFQLVVTGAFWAAGRLDSTAVLALAGLSTLVGIVVCVPALATLARDGSPDHAVSRADVLRVGLSNHVGLIALWIALRIDVFIVAALVSKDELGVYTLAVTLAEFAILATDALALAALSNQVALPREESGHYGAAISADSARLALAEAAVLAILGWPLIRYLFGPEWTGAYPVLLAFLPGIAGLAYARPIGVAFVRAGRSLERSVALVVAAAVTLVGTLVLVPQVGIVGGGLASSAGYLLGALILAVRGRRSLGVAPWAPSIVIPRMREAWVEHRARLADRPPPRPDEPPDWRRELLPLAAIAFAAAVTPIWSRTAGGLPAQLYIGRFAVLLLAACALLRVGRLPQLAGRRWLTAGTACLVCLGLLLSWLLTNAASVGCVRCAGSASGFAEFTVAAILVAFLCIDNAAVRRFAVPLTLLAPAVAIILSIPAVVRFWRPTGSITDGRLAGVYDNPNTLGFILALAVPVLVVCLVSVGPRRRWAPAVGLAVVVAGLLMTFSRSGILSAFVAGFLVLFWHYRGSRRALVRVTVGCLASAALLAVLYPPFQTWREDVSFRAQREAFLALDRSGWNRARQGPIPRGPSTIANPNGSTGRITVTADRGEGVSYEWGKARRGTAYAVSAQVRSLDGTEQLSAAVQDDAAANGSSERRIALGPAWRSVRLGWRPRGDAEHARAFLWLPAGGVFEVRRLAVGRAGGGGPLVSASTALQGSLPEAQLQSRFQAAESRFVESRFTGLRLAADAFRQKPLTGIGWEAFPAYAAAHASFGLLASHDEYARIAAELGFPGLILIAAIVLTLVLAIRRVPASPTRLAAAGLLAAAGVNLAFVNALVTPTTSLPIALALGWICFPRAVAPAPKRAEAAPPEPALTTGSAVDAS